MTSVRVAPILLLPLLLALGGCASLLPAATSDASSSFQSFKQAKAAFERIEPLKTPASALKLIGFDTEGIQNVRLIPYPDLVSRLAPNASIAMADLDPGIRDCIQARMACIAYEFHFARESRERKGNFMLDFLNFKRTTWVRSWRFDALVVVSGGVVLFRNFGGEPDNERIEHQVNPLGPLQSGGESLAGQMLR